MAPMKLFIATVALLAAAHASSFAAIDSYMTITGQRQGVIHGTGPQGSIKLMSLASKALTMSEVRSGVPERSKRPWSEIVVTKTVDKSSPLLKRALAGNEPMTITIVVNRPGTANRLYTITLTNAHISSIKTAADDESPKESVAETESISFTFQKIEWTYTRGNATKTMSDDWTQ